MASEPVPSLQIEPHHAQAMTLVGTVALPSPYPAEGRIFLVRHPVPAGSQGNAARPTFHVKVVQKISDSHTITRFVDIDHVRLVRLSPRSEEKTSDTTEPAAEMLDDKDLKKELAAIAWGSAGETNCHPLEVELRPGQTGVVHVPEAAPVLLRYDCTVTAATSLENVAGSGLFSARILPSLACPRRC